MSPSRVARQELHRYVESRQKWTPADIGDTVVALVCAIGFVWMVVV